ncbi:MAG TPA: adenylate/guanylate cyclase domain-containing protein, partial [Chthonomonadales bacterium]|nr:adenylate/guanylate cyclase domain-containing protein [Chthonomonadales bacterium]
MVGAVGLLAWPLVFYGLWAVGWTGAAVGVFAVRKRPNIEGAAAAGVNAWWLLTLTAIAMQSLLDRVGIASSSAEFLLPSTPFLTLLAVRAALSKPATGSKMRSAWSNWLVWKWTFRGRQRRLDLRGHAVGMMAAGLILSADHLALISPLQSSLLVSMMRIRADSVSIGNKAIRIGKEGSGRAGNRRILVLQMDDPTRYAALISRSECDIQAEVVRRLAKWGALRTVLPAPRFTTAASGDLKSGSAEPGAPTLNSGSAARCRRDLPELVSAMRGAGNVVLAVNQAPPAPSGGIVIRANGKAPPASPDAEFIGKLKQAALQTGSSDLKNFRASDLPAIPIHDAGDGTPVPVIVAAALRSTGSGVGPNIGPLQAVVAGRRIPLVSADLALPEFPGTGPGAVFDAAPYSAVLNNAPVWIAGSDGGGQWIPVAQAVRGKAVILDGLDSPLRDSPTGPVPRNELLANAAAALLTGRLVSAATPRMVLLLALALGIAVGARCARRSPIDSVPFVAVAALSTVLAGAYLFFLFSLWIDTVLPVIVCLTAYLLTTQFTYSTEHAEREHNRALLQRFVAPGVVDEFLDDPGKLGLGGTRRHVCVLFADVRNFTGFSERHTPEEVIEVVNSYMTGMTDALDEFGGILDKYTGDGLMALFPVDGDPPQVVARAIRAALAMRDVAASLSARRMEEGKEPL